MPTLISAAGGHAFEVTGRDHDGIDLLPIFLGIGKRREWIDLVERPWFSYHGQAGQDQEHLAVTHKGWKLKVNGPRLQRVDQLTDGSRQVELFHLENDLLESKDLKDKHPEKVRALGALLIEHRNLQPESSVPPYRVGNQGFVPPKQWQLNPEEPDELVGHSAD
jgi:arylsulfatase A-like enzyme